MTLANAVARIDALESRIDELIVFRNTTNLNVIDLIS